MLNLVSCLLAITSPEHFLCTVILCPSSSKDHHHPPPLLLLSPRPRVPAVPRPAAGAERSRAAPRWQQGSARACQGPLASESPSGTTGTDWAAHFKEVRLSPVVHLSLDAGWGLEGARAKSRARLESGRRQGCVGPTLSQDPNWELQFPWGKLRLAWPGRTAMGC